MSLDERLEAITMNLELMSREGEAQQARMEELGMKFNETLRLLQIDAENIRALARIAEAHEHRLERLERDE